MKICVIGTGYVGLVVGACFADFGNHVICVDADMDKIAGLAKGIVPVYEPGLKKLIDKNTAAEKLKFSSDIKEGIKKSEIIFIVVSASAGQNGSPDTNAVESVAVKIGENIDSYKVIINKSTVPVGTCGKIRGIIGENLKKETDFDMVSNPEFLREGSAIRDFMRPGRVIAGVENKRPLKVLKKLYGPVLNKSGNNFFVTSPENAEMIKYASNAFLAVKISFINEIAYFCELTGTDVKTVAGGMGMDKRIGHDFFNAGPGYGGSCLTGDIASLDFMARARKYDFRILRAVTDVNERQKLLMVKKIEEKMGGLKNKTIGILGLSFKPDTDDMRESPSIVIINKLLEKGAKIKAFDPAAMNEAKKIFSSKIEFCDNSYQAAQNSDALVFITEWNEFRGIDFKRVGKLLKTRLIFDLRNIFEPEKIKSLGFEYIGVGRSMVNIPCGN